MDLFLKCWENPNLYITIAAYLMAMTGYWFLMFIPNNWLRKIAAGLTILGLVSNTFIIIIRTISAQRLPLTNGYEFILAFCWGIVLVFVFSLFKFKLDALGSFVMPLPILLLVFVLIGMSPDNRIITAIPPVLNSNWLTMHVITAIFSYGAFAVAFALALMYLAKTYWVNSVLVRHFPASEFLDELSYKLIILAFSLLTLVIITGAIWANYAWGTYWSWDPKETWSLITWLIYAAYLHARLMYDWKGKRSAWLVVLGFAAVLFTFFGVNYLLPGLHSYA